MSHPWYASSKLIGKEDIPVFQLLHEAACKIRHVEDRETACYMVGGYIRDAVSSV